MSTLAVLQEARKRIVEPENWIQDSFARTLDDKETEYDSIYAQKFCAVGAIRAEVGNANNQYIESAICTLQFVVNRLNGQTGEMHVSDDLISWNDDPERTHADVMMAYNIAIGIEM